MYNIDTIPSIISNALLFTVDLYSGSNNENAPVIISFVLSLLFRKRNLPRRRNVLMGQNRD